MEVRDGRWETNNGTWEMGKWETEEERETRGKDLLASEGRCENWMAHTMGIGSWELGAGIGHEFPHEFPGGGFAVF